MSSWDFPSAKAHEIAAAPALESTCKQLEKRSVDAHIGGTYPPAFGAQDENGEAESKHISLAGSNINQSKEGHAPGLLAKRLSKHAAARQEHRGGSSVARSTFDSPFRGGESSMFKQVVGVFESVVGVSSHRSVEHGGTEKEHGTEVRGSVSKLKQAPSLTNSRGLSTEPRTRQGDGVLSTSHEVHGSMDQGRNGGGDRDMMAPYPPSGKKMVRVGTMATF